MTGASINAPRVLPVPKRAARKGRRFTLAGPSQWERVMPLQLAEM